MERFERKIWLSSPMMHGEEMRYVQEAYDTNWMSTIGENITSIERQISELVGCQYAVALSSCTAALHLAVKLAGVKRGEKVFCSDMTFAATLNPVVYEGGVPVFIDSEADTWNMDPRALEKAFAAYPEVKTVVLAHLYGVPAKMAEIQEICKRHQAVLIEDAAEALGATYKGAPVGAGGTYNCVSFNGNKIITGSSGGMLLTDDKAAADKARKLSTQARENAPWYQHEEIGYNYRMSNVIAGVVRGQLPYLQDHVARKRAIYERYREGLKDLPICMNPFDADNSEPNYWLSCMTVQPQAMCTQRRDAVCATYQSEKGKSCPTEILEKLLAYNVEGRPIWKPMHMQPVFAGHAFVSAEDTPINEDIFERGLCLPSDVNMTPAQQGGVIEIIKSCFEES